MLFMQFFHLLLFSSASAPLSLTCLCILWPKPLVSVCVCGVRVRVCVCVCACVCASTRMSVPVHIFGSHSLQRVMFFFSLFSIQRDWTDPCSNCALLLALKAAWDHHVCGHHWIFCVNSWKLGVVCLFSASEQKHKHLSLHSSQRGLTLFSVLLV